MYFKKLELFGFKSFADKTVLNFEPGITAIVGPNGCGKSNIFDAIRWVLGEQSVKELRGAAMEDVIFNGTDKKASLGFAEVSLTFSNEARSLPIEYDEVTITRRLFRSGESEYLMNKIVVRLKDIQELLMGTGIGAEAYSLVQQGKVDLVVSAKPEDRRMILDEASGITKYKSKKREALNKLKDTENNLLRLNDIIIEVKRQIASIERQANKARKYKEEFENLKDLEIKLARYQRNSFADEKNKIQACLEDLKVQEEKWSRELEEFSSQLTNEINFLDELEDKINEAHSQEIKMEGQIDLNNRQVGFNAERIENLNQNTAKLKDQKEQLIEKCRIQQERIEELKKILADLQAASEFNEQILGEKRSGLISVEKLIKESKEKIKEDDEKILNLTVQQVSVRNEVTDIMKEMQGSLARKRRLELENEKVLGEKQQADDRLQSLEQQIGSVQGIMNELENTRSHQAQALSSLKESLSVLDGKITELEKKKMFFISQEEFIEKLNVQYQDMPDPIVDGRFFTNTTPLAHHTGIIGKVKEVIPVDPSRLENFRQSLSAENQKLFEIVCETKFIELDPQQILIKIEEIGVEINQMLNEKQAIVAQVEEQILTIEQTQHEIHQREKSYSIFESQKNDILNENKKLSDELEMLTVELSDVRVSLVSFKKKEDELNYTLDTINQDVGWCQNDIKEKQAWIAGKLQEKEEITVCIAQLETEIASQKDKLIFHQDSYKEFSEGLDGWLEEIKKIDDEAASQAIKIQQYEAENRALEINIEEIKNNKDSLKTVLSEYEAQKNEVGQRINSGRAHMNSMQDEIEKIKQGMHVQQMKEQEFSFNEKGIVDRLLQIYKISLEEILAQDQAAQENQEVVNYDELMADLEKLRKRCDAYGSVNLVAIEEFEELKQRFEFLTKQQSDLLEAKSQLMSTIQKINRSTRQMFMDTFTKVSEEFRIYFRMLFGGGEANLVLLDPENVLESGIEIIARPPGKKLQSISLMSGGEKTLTAIALIFGVFKVNPSPFCVLDEIDAALDEANVGRFSYLLKDFAKIAQFIVITHNKKTIAISDVMYGITMPETGVSRIVSVKFSEDKKLQREEAAVSA